MLGYSDLWGWKVISGFWILCCTMHTGWAWERLYNGGLCDSSLTLLPLSSLTYNKEGLVSFAYSHFSSLLTWFVCFAILIKMIMLLMLY